jgi:hypothetical protein
MIGCRDREEDDLIGWVMSTENTGLDFLDEYCIQDDVIYGEDDFDKIYNPYE